MRRFAGIVAGTVLFILAVPFLLLAGWGLAFNVPTLAVVAFTAAWILLPLFNQIKAIRVLKFAVSFVLIPAALALSPFMIGEVDRQVEALSRKNRHDPSAFDLRDRLGIYGLNIVMGVVGYPLYPEASKETLLMMLKPGPSARRVFNSGFGLGSRKVKDRLSEFAASLETDARTETGVYHQGTKTQRWVGPEMSGYAWCSWCLSGSIPVSGSDDSASSRSYGPVRIEWDRSDYQLTQPEARYALALNQTSLTAKAERRGERWLIDVRHEVKIKYPDSVLVTLISRPRLRMEEGLFWVLQNCGWLHPYTAEWRFLVASDDKRLR